MYVVLLASLQLGYDQASARWSESQGYSKLLVIPLERIITT